MCRILDWNGPSRSFSPGTANRWPREMFYLTLTSICFYFYWNTSRQDISFLFLHLLHYILLLCTTSFIYIIHLPLQGILVWNIRLQLNPVLSPFKVKLLKSVLRVSKSLINSFQSGVTSTGLSRWPVAFMLLSLVAGTDLICSPPWFSGKYSPGFSPTSLASLSLPPLIPPHAHVFYTLDGPRYCSWACSFSPSTLTLLMNKWVS